MPRPVPGPTEVLVRTVASVISPGTERAVTALAQSSLLAKARARPDLVRQVVRKARTEGLAATAAGGPQPARRGPAARLLRRGIVLEAAPRSPGSGPGSWSRPAGRARRTTRSSRPCPGCSAPPVPAACRAEDAAFTTIAAIALHGLRLAEVGPGSKVVVLGLGLIGQLAARLAMAAGCDVAGIDPAGHARRRRGGSRRAGPRRGAARPPPTRCSPGPGAGARTPCWCARPGRSSDAVMRVPALCRDRAAVVIVGDVGLQLDRTPFYERELSLRFARSYGPGRYDPSYEAWGVDYPAGQVRWTEGRNFEAVLDLLAAAGCRSRTW